MCERSFEDGRACQLRAATQCRLQFTRGLFALRRTWVVVSGTQQGAG